MVFIHTFNFSRISVHDVHSFLSLDFLLNSWNLSIKSLFCIPTISNSVYSFRYKASIWFSVIYLLISSNIIWIRDFMNFYFLLSSFYFLLQLSFFWLFSVFVLYFILGTLQIIIFKDIKENQSKIAKVTTYLFQLNKNCNEFTSSYSHFAVRFIWHKKRSHSSQNTEKIVDIK